jgi:hypothetical protein
MPGTAMPHTSCSNCVPQSLDTALVRYRQIADNSLRGLAFSRTERDGTAPKARYLESARVGRTVLLYSLSIEREGGRFRKNWDFG